MTTVINAMDEVIASYTSDIEDVANQQVLIQHQAIDVVYSGVLFTYDIQGQRPYYLINYDDSGSTDSVTSGIGGKTLWVARNTEPAELDEAWQNLLDAVNEIEKLLQIPLDIEFAINKNNEIIIFQVRPLVANFSKNKQAALSFKAFFEKINHLKNDYRFIKNIITGKNMMFSDMAFWNPSEIIGTSPRTLDYSLYRFIITSKAWNEGLVPMGYKRLDDELMYKIGVKPYISLEYSFYSLIPAKISEELADRLVQFYSNKLKKDITAHDKIEFEIVYSSYDFNTWLRTTELLDYGFSSSERKEIVEALKELTLNNVLEYNKVSLKEQVVDFAPQPVITKDNVTMQIDTVVYYQITDPRLFTYGVDRPINAIENLTATTLRNIIGDLELDETLTSRDIINSRMRSILDEATDPWGIKVHRVEVKNIIPPRDIQEAMEKQMRAERERREAILQAEGKKTAAILNAEGDKQSTILRAEAEKEAAIAKAEGQAEALRLVYEAQAKGITYINDAHPDQAYVTLQGFKALENLSKGDATKIIIPSELQGIAGLATTLKEVVTEKKDKE